jgi:hypothetical protein
MSETTRLTNDFVNWSVSNYTKYDSNTKIKAVSGNNITVTHAITNHTFVLDEAASAGHITLELKKFFFTGDADGSARAVVTLIDPNSVHHVLYDDDDDEYTDFTEVLSALDISAYLTLAGTYTLRLEAYVQSAYIAPTYYPAEVHYGNILLTADTGVSYDIHIDDVVTPTEGFEIADLARHIEDVATPVEGFSIVRAVAVAAQRPILVVATNNAHQIFTFESGAPLGYFRTPQIDFGLPGIDKTLDEILVLSNSPTPINVNVYVSVDSGKTFDFISAVSIQRGVTGYVHPWITTESFILEFSGLGLHIFSYAAYARPSGPDTDDD